MENPMDSMAVASTTSKPRKSRLNKRITFFDVLIHAILIVVVLACLLPFLYVLIVSFTDPDVYVPWNSKSSRRKFPLRYIGPS